MATKICPKCKTEFQAEYQFCTECGARLVERESEPEARPQERPSEQAPSAEKTIGPSPREKTPAKALRFRLIRLARGGGQRVEYDIPERGVVIGRYKADITFAEDETVSPRHATVRPAGDYLEVEDASSLNGVFIKIRGEHRLAEGDIFMCGDQVFRVSLRPGRFDPSEWQLYAAPQEARPLATLTHLLSDGSDGAVYPVRKLPFVIGREEGSLLFGTDRFMSRKHAAIQQSGGSLVLVDLGSRNGTYVCRHGEFRITDGDVIMIGRQLLRVEAVAQ